MRTPMNFEQLEDAIQRKQKKLTHTGLIRRFGNPAYHFAYVYGITPKGKPVIWGPMSEAQAEEHGDSLLEAEVFFCDTKDVSEATKQIKAELMRRGMNPDDAIGRKSHTGYEPENKIKRSINNLFKFRKKNS